MFYRCWKYGYVISETPIIPRMVDPVPHLFVGYGDEGKGYLWPVQGRLHAAQSDLVNVEDWRKEAAHLKGLLPEVEARAAEAEARAVQVEVRNAHLPAAHIPARLCHDHVLAEDTPVRLVGGVVQDAEGDLLGWWPKGTKVVIHHKPRGRDSGWATLEWPPGTTGTKYASQADERAVDLLAWYQVKIPELEAKAVEAEARIASLTPGDLEVMEWAKLPSPPEENPWRPKNVEPWKDRVGIGHFTW
jgi:hypothetical protein